MKILILVDKFNGGAGNIAQIISSELSNRQNEVTLVLTDDPEKKSKHKHLLSGVRLVYLPKPDNKNKLYLLKSHIGNRKDLFKTLEPDIVISFLLDNNLFSTIAARHFNIPIIVSERSNPIMVKGTLLLRLLRWCVYKKADIVSVQFDCFKGFLSNVRKERYRCLPNVILENHKPKINYNIDWGVFRMVAVGNLRSIKNYIGMLNIVKQAKERGLEISLDIYGEGNQREILEEIIVRYDLCNDVYLKGHVLNVYDILPMYDCYLMTSFQEGFPNALSEAMASGLPCVAYKCHDGFSELIRDGYDGYLITSGEEQKFVDRIENLYTDRELRRYIGQNAIEISSRYSVDRVLAIWEQCIQDAINIHNGLHTKN